MFALSFAIFFAVEGIKLLTPVLFRPYIRPAMSRASAAFSGCWGSAKRAATVAVLGRLPAKEAEAVTKTGVQAAAAIAAAAEAKARAEAAGIFPSTVAVVEAMAPPARVRVPAPAQAPFPRAATAPPFVRHARGAVEQGQQLAEEGREAGPPATTTTLFLATSASTVGYPHTTEPLLESAGQYYNAVVAQPLRRAQRLLSPRI